MSKGKRGHAPKSPEFEASKFKPGQSGNPKGGSKLRSDLMGIKVMDQLTASRLIQKIMDMTPEELRVMVNDKKTPSWELMVARLIDKAINEGDVSRLQFLFDRTIGKVLEKRELEIIPVTYRTGVREDGTLVQDVIKASLEDAAGDSESRKP